MATTVAVTKFADTFSGFVKTGQHDVRPFITTGGFRSREMNMHTISQSSRSPTPPSADDEDDEPIVACGIMPNSLVSLFRRSGRSASVDCGDTKTKSFTMKTSSKGSPNSKNKNTCKTNYKSGENDSKVKNIYRKPVSRSGSRPRTDSYSRTFPNSSDHRLNIKANGSTGDSDEFLESEPDGKDERRDSVDHMNDQLFLKRPTDLFTCNDISDGKVSDFRRRACSMPAIPPSILRKRQPPERVGSISQNRSPTNRHACFKNEVDVYYFDSSESLKTAQAMVNTTQSHSNHSSSPSDIEIIKIDLANVTNASTDLETSAGTVTESKGCGLKCSISTEVTPSIDTYGQRGRHLRLCITTDESCNKDRTTVKSMSGGGAVIVKFVKDDQQNGKSCDQEDFTKKIVLPFKIDPYQVRAKIEREGNLTIEAPMLSQSRLDVM